MKLVLSAHKVSLTDSIKEHVRSRIEKLESQDGHALSAFVNLERDHEGMPKKKFICTVRVNLPGQTLVARDAEDDLYTAIDLVTKKIQQQIRKRHSKFKAKNTRVAADAKRALLTIAA
jgi:putative sigma-54 modulation protein